jgi:hypothetical protein
MGALPYCRFFQAVKAGGSTEPDSVDKPAARGTGQVRRATEQAARAMVFHNWPATRIGRFAAVRMGNTPP